MAKARKKFIVFHGGGEGEMNRWFWQLRSGNSKIIADGAEGYATVNSALRAVKQINSLLREPLPVEVEQ